MNYQYGYMCNSQGCYADFYRPIYILSLSLSRCCVGNDGASEWNKGDQDAFLGDVLLR